MGQSDRLKTARRAKDVTTPATVMTAESDCERAGAPLAALVVIVLFPLWRFRWNDCGRVSCTADWMGATSERFVVRTEDE